MLIIGLVEEDIFAIPAFSRPFFEDTVTADPMLGTKALPEYGTHWIARKMIYIYISRIDNLRTLIPALTKLHRDNLARHG